MSEPCLQHNFGSNVSSKSSKKCIILVYLSCLCKLKRNAQKVEVKAGLKVVRESWAAGVHIVYKYLSLLNMWFQRYCLMCEKVVV